MTDPQADAPNRAWRTFLQGLAYTVGAAVVMVLLPVFTNATGWASFDWSVIGFSLVQSVGMAVLAWLMRAYLDRRTDALAQRPPDERGVMSTGVAIAVGVVLGILLWVVILGPLVHHR